MYFVSQRESLDDRWRFFWDGANGGLSLFSVISTSAKTARYTWSPSNNTWYHLAAIRSSGYIYVNGQLLDLDVITDPDFSSVDISIDGILTIGANYNGTSGFYNGYIQSLRISKQSARWTTSFIPPNKLYCLNS